jgi:hypothetical protein
MDRGVGWGELDFFRLAGVGRVSGRLTENVTSIQNPCLLISHELVISFIFLSFRVDGLAAAVGRSGGGAVAGRAGPSWWHGGAAVGCAPADSPGHDRVHGTHHCASHVLSRRRRWLVAAQVAGRRGKTFGAAAGVAPETGSDRLRPRLRTWLLRRGGGAPPPPARHRRHPADRRHDRRVAWEAATLMEDRANRWRDSARGPR